MVSRSELGSDPSFGSGRESGRDMPSPTNVKTVRQFLGHAGFYRRFIKDFSKIAKPLYKLLEKDAKFS